MTPDFMKNHDGIRNDIGQDGDNENINQYSYRII